MTSILVLGLSHRTAPVDVRERFAANGDALPQVLARLSARPELRETLFLSTCNRVEVFSNAAGDPSTGRKRAIAAIREVLAEYAGVTPSDLAPYLYEKHGEDAVRHIFRVTASLDSMVLGEPQILGQVKDAYDAALAAGTLGHLLGRCVHRAFTVAKRVRSETALGAGLVSISSVAVDLARRIFGDLAGHTVLLVGAGEMAEAAAKSLGKGGKGIRVANRTLANAQALATSVGGTAAPWSALEEELVGADVVVTSTGATNYVITADMVKRVRRARKGRTLFFIDIAVPRNVDPNVHGLDNVYVFNVDDLQEQVAEGLKSRQKEVSLAEGIVNGELSDYVTWARSLDVQPAVVALRAKTRAVLLGELERTLAGRLKHLGEGDRAALEQMMESAVNKLLHAPTTRLKAGAVNGAESEEHVKTLKHLFDLPELPRTAEETRARMPREHEPHQRADDDERIPH
ncbi:glutamyl-tRNA reductase [Pendulispora rubella]|uniref:Glutamyl-tRNA reductase n=1 Tax=Pendulispora rubella TaxID=2741070 RepID=A0ABZ2KXM4_9BACT